MSKIIRPTRRDRRAMKRSIPEWLTVRLAFEAPTTGDLVDMIAGAVAVQESEQMWEMLEG